jgi:hypothetical protein
VSVFSTKQKRQKPMESQTTLFVCNPQGGKQMVSPLSNENGTIVHQHPLTKGLALVVLEYTSNTGKSAGKSKQRNVIAIVASNLQEAIALSKPLAPAPKPKAANSSLSEEQTRKVNASWPTGLPPTWNPTQKMGEQKVANKMLLISIGLLSAEATGNEVARLHQAVAAHFANK